MNVKQLIGRLNSYNMDAEVELLTTDGLAGELEFVIDSGDTVDNGNTTHVSVKIVAKPADPEPTV